MDKILIFGHQKPDTDSVTSAIVLSYLKNKLGEKTFPRVLGEINKETKFVLKHFGFRTPKFLNDVRLQVKDVDYVTDCFLTEDDSIFDGYRLMKDTTISTIPVVSREGKYLGAAAMKDVIHNLITGDLGWLETSYDNLLEALNGEEILRFDEKVVGEIIVPSYRSITFKEKVNIDRNSVLIVGDRYGIIDYAIKSKASIIILTNGVDLKDEFLDLARKNKVDIISTDYKAITAANLVVLSNFIKNNLRSDIITVNENDALYEVMDLANKKKFSNYPVLNNEGELLGIFRPNIADSRHPKKVILVDHNEKEQSVVGLDEAEIVEIVDHHKIGNIGTSFPINFRNMPLGSTQTILYLMFKENNVEITKKIAGLMLSGIISDTLLLSSPTTTDIDRRALVELACIAEVDYKKYGMEMFKAGSSIKGLGISEVIHSDFKNFTIDAQKFGIGQVSTMNTEEIMNKKDKFISTLNDLARDEDYAVIALFVTDILNKGSYLLFNDKARDILSGAFDVSNIAEGQFIEGIVSRKKQIVPKIMNYMDMS